LKWIEGSNYRVWLSIVIMSSRQYFI
jgi:hypothetical protein